MARVTEFCFIARFKSDDFGKPWKRCLDGLISRNLEEKVVFSDWLSRLDRRCVSEAMKNLYEM